MESKKILIVEDDIIIAADIKKTLEKSGCKNLVIAGSGREAIKCAINIKPDLILMDIMLKGKMTGIEAAEIISHKMNTPVIFISALTDDETFLNAALAKPYSFISKPFHHKHLVKTVKEAIEK